MKTCSKCKLVKPITEYYKDIRSSDGLFSHCKSCHKIYTNNYSATIPPEIKRKYWRQWRENNIERIKNYPKYLMSEQTKLKNRMRAKRYYRMNKDSPEFIKKVKEIMRKYYLANKKKIAAKHHVYKKQYNQTEHSKILNRINSKKQTIKHPDRIKCRKRTWEAIKNGKIIRPIICSNCKQNGKIEAHHYNGYDKWQDIIWLCRKCHRNIHSPMPYEQE